MNRLPEVRTFVKELAKDYENVEVKFIGGHNPEAYFFDAEDNQVEMIDLKPMKLAEIEKAFADRGFVKKEEHSEL